jgi:hypothetical protein
MSAYKGRTPGSKNKIQVCCVICGLPQVAKELCKIHYKRLYMTGSTKKPQRFKSMTKTIIMSDLDIAWLAGILEGEGCFSTPSSKRGMVITVSMTDKDIIERLTEITGIGTISSSTPTPPRKPYWNWRVSTTADSIRIALSVAPFLGERRRNKILEILETI